MVSPPSAGFAAELMAGELPPGTTMRYDLPSVPGLEHHLVLLDGTLQLTVDGERHDLTPGDSLRYRLWGPTAFTPPGRCRPATSSPSASRHDHHHHPARTRAFRGRAAGAVRHAVLQRGGGASIGWPDTPSLDTAADYWRGCCRPLRAGERVFLVALATPTTRPAWSAPRS
jgi:hypothetical protein